MNNNRLKKILKDYGLTNQELADHMKVNVETIRSWIKYTYNPSNGNPMQDTSMLLLDLLIETRVIK